MAVGIRKTPLDLPRAVPFRKSYSALICEDGTILHIEERLGRRVLRTLDPFSREGRGLLRRGTVRLTSTEGAVFAGLAVGDVLDVLSERTARSLAKKPNDPIWQRRCNQARERIGELRRSFSPDH